MVTITGSVGRSAQNQPHDVAVIQAALGKLAATPNQFGGPGLYAGPIDGRSTPELEVAIGLLEIQAQIHPVGRIDPIGPALNALKSRLPMDQQGLVGIPGTAAVAITGGGASGGSLVEEAARVMRERTLLPMKAAQALERLMRDVHRSTGLVLTPAGHGIDPQGHLLQGLAFAGLRWLGRDGRATDQLPFEHAGAIMTAVRRVPLPQDLDWHQGAAPSQVALARQTQKVGLGALPTRFSLGGSDVLAVRFRDPFPSLSDSLPPPDAARLTRFGLRASGDPILNRLLAGALIQIEA
jgi:hypothetical protein